DRARRPAPATSEVRRRQTPRRRLLKYGRPRCSRSMQQEPISGQDGIERVRPIIALTSRPLSSISTLHLIFRIFFAQHLTKRAALARAAFTTASTVIDGSCLSGHQFEGNVLPQLLRCPLARLPIAATAGRFQDQAAVRRYRLETLASQLLSGKEVYSAACTGASAPATLRGMLHPFEHGKERERRRMSGADLDLQT